MPHRYILPKKCPYCHKMNIKLMTHIEVYGKEFDGGGKLWVCQDCQARVGCHKGTKIPLGPLSDEELRGLRMKIHAIIDKRWKTSEERKKVYAELGKVYGKPFHVGHLNNYKAHFVLADLLNQPNP